eukprot:CAMPEP_0194109624 /NCGR_PEP_ID=MMETSP0150-20130528/9073_1 /TAXON_ID=122233 /ORGANISM="Chaetoceros debilis, Strain MM31A-1" /LENGTH=423 /DNA_ID=CAMNT_0038798619 /DNA_START=96 /DNA_END=1364 /DNA_ORIENTATION=+
MKTTATCLLALLSAPSAISFQPNAAGISCGYKVSASKLISTGTEQCGESNMSLQVFSNNEVVEGASNVEMSSRRQWMTKSATVASSIAVASANPFASFAETETLVTTPSKSSSPVSSPLCDPSVSTFRNPSNNRVVYILGTAHISSASADVAGQLVRDTKPSAVFVELDAKRVGRAIPKPSVSGKTSGDISISDTAGEAAPETATPVLVSAPISSPVVNVVEVEVPPSSRPPPTKSNPFNLKEKLLNNASKLVGNSIKGLYSKLESEGFSAGEEFVVAVREGLKIGSTIVLGDQDVEVTLRRLTEALSKTDLKKLLAADSEMEQNMKQLMPDSGKAIETTGEMSSEQLTYFVETIKARENVKLLMTNLQSVAPEIYNAMVKERDEYMANGLDKLNQYDSIVAVVGIAHVDGIERFLMGRGWEE